MSIKKTLMRIAVDAATLVKAEIDLAKTETKEKTSQLGAGVGMMAGAAVLALFAYGTLLLTFGYLLALVMPLFLAFLIVSLLQLAVTGLLIKLGLDKFEEVKETPQTVTSIEETKEWVKNKFKKGNG